VPNLLLDDYSGAAAAYSIRLLRGGYTGNALRIREDSGNTETDIGFDANGDLDTAAIASHCGSANGYVVTWYDQANSNDATQSTASAQPQIYNGSSVLIKNNSPAIHFDGSNDVLKYTGNFLGGSAATGVSVSSFRLANAANRDIVYGAQDLSGARYDFAVVRRQDDTLDLYIEGNFQTDTGSITDTDQHLLIAIYSNNTRRVIYDNGSVLKTLTNNALGNLDDATDFLIGADISGPSNYFDGSMQELVIWNSDQEADANRTGIESNVNTYFSIY
jgi:hypothetical protein